MPVHGRPSHSMIDYDLLFLMTDVSHWPWPRCCMTICTGWMFLSGCSTSWRWWSTVVWDGEPRRTSLITACRSPRFLVASICDPPVAVNSSFLASVAALSALVLSPLRAQQFGILCLTVCVIRAVGPDQFRRDLKTHLFEWHCVSFSALAVFSRNALYKSTFYLLTYLLGFSLMSWSWSS